MGTILCPSCKAANPPAVGVCRQCGGDIPLDEPVAAPGDSPPEGEGAIEEEILSLLEGGKKIEAIKLYRAKTGQGLKEAYDAVTAIAQRHGVGPARSGCAGVVAAAICLLVAWWWVARHLLT